MIRVMIVDDHPVFRQGLRDVVTIDPTIEVVAEVGDGRVAIQQAYIQQPDVILLDINLPTLNGLQVANKIKAGLPDVKIITITGYDDAYQILHALRAGASGYCPKDIPPDALIRGIYDVHEGSYVIGEKTMTYDELLVWLQDTFGMDDPLNEASAGSQSSLSAREMEILEEVTRGNSNKQIALRLGISHQTVKNHMTAILKKLNVDDRTQAAVYALSKGWVRLENPNDE